MIEAEAVAAEAASKVDASRTTYKQAIDQGLIPAGQSRWMIDLWQRQRARSAGRQSNLSLREWYAESDIQNSDDPEEVMAALQEQQGLIMAEFGLDDLGPLSKLTLLKMTEGSLNTILNRHIESRAQAVEQGVLDAHADETMDAVDIARAQPAGFDLA